MGNTSTTGEENEEEQLDCVVPTESVAELLAKIKPTEDISLSDVLTAIGWLRRTVHNIIEHPDNERHQKIHTSASSFKKTFKKFPDRYSILLKIGFKRIGIHFKIDVTPEVVTHLKTVREDINKAVMSLTDGIAFTHAYLPHMATDKWAKHKKLLSSDVKSLEQLDDLFNKLSDSGASNNANFFKAYYSDEFCEAASRKESKDEFFNVLLPFIQKLALKIEELFPDKLDILPAGKDTKLVLTREQVACLLSHFFFCTFEHPNIIHGGLGFNDCDFSLLFMTDYASAAGQESLYSNTAESVILCIMQYFRRVQKQMPTGNVVIHRKVVDTFVDWSTSTKPLLQIKVDDKMKIEDSPAKFHADFANQFIGGGALHGGCVQEEILFAIKPECYVSMFLCPKMNVNEAIVISGTERFSQYSGYARDFKYAGPFEDKTPMNATLGCIDNHLFCIDAVVNFGNRQFEKQNIDRDINKAYVGLCRPEEYHTGGDLLASTGNWGCGAFGGHLELKAIQQCMAASELGIPLLYHTFNKPPFAKALEDFGLFCATNEVSIKDVYEAILAFKPKKFRNEIFKGCIKYLSEKKGLTTDEPVKEEQITPEDTPSKEEADVKEISEQVSNVEI